MSMIEANFLFIGVRVIGFSALDDYYAQRLRLRKRAPALVYRIVTTVVRGVTGLFFYRLHWRREV